MIDLADADGRGISRHDRPNPPYGRSKEKTRKKQFRLRVSGLASVSITAQPNPDFLHDMPTALVLRGERLFAWGGPISEHNVYPPPGSRNRNPRAIGKLIYLILPLSLFALPEVRTPPRTRFVVFRRSAN